MTTGRLVASVCALGLIAAPAFAATDTSNPTDTNAGTGTTMHHHTWHRTTHAGRAGGQSATSQDAAVDRLNQESLQAAQQNRAFEPPGAGGAGGGGGGGTSGGAGASDTSSGSKM